MNADVDEPTERLAPARAAGLTPEKPKWNHAQRRAFARYLSREEARIARKQVRIAHQAVSMRFERERAQERRDRRRARKSPVTPERASA